MWDLTRERHVSGCTNAAIFKIEIMIILAVEIRVFGLFFFFCQPENEKRWRLI